ncbi:MAG: hypothetical protein A2086_06285 [Spirochaetes bacterium GWD1_27_9]|nr:MAG: hypothetical protein A2Z98_05390 [Spirochaetes bacterium GWB1_27_13]OHD27865.1 MAG: hypothetical protein A2Y34_14500 [Spirochaetes bacterium GWC1_27_15]OHD30873.1 MAG: hypothetical protein A2086_06285 [Spirochaetes bacterium GWD1_27_9]
MNLKKYFLLFYSLLSLSFLFTEDLTKDNYNFLKDYIYLDPSDDFFANLKNYKISKDYVKSLIYNKNIEIFVLDFDNYNLTKNTNTLPYFPYIFAPYGGFITNRGFDLGFLYRMENINDSKANLTFSTSFAQNGYFYQNISLENFLQITNCRFRIFNTFSFFNSIGQYNAALNYDYSNNSLLNTSNKIWKTLNINFSQRGESGFNFISGFDYRIPLAEINTINYFEFFYKYIDKEYDGLETASNGDTKPREITINKSNFFLNIASELRFARLKKSTTIPLGNYLSLGVKLFLPWQKEYFNKNFGFKAKLEERFYYKFYKEFAFKFRSILFGGYNISYNLSGDPFVRGIKSNDFSGFFALIGNFDLYLPAISVYMKESMAVEFKNEAKFVLYINIFADFGLAIENYNYVLENLTYRKQNQKSSLAYLIKDDFYFVPALSAGGGIKIYCYSWPFIIRFDVGADMLKAIIKQEANLEFVVSFNDMF